MNRVIISGLCVVCSLLSGCSGYREDFSCRTNPDSGMCARVSDVYHAGLGGKTSEAGGRGRGVQSDPFAGVRTKEVLGKPLIQAPEVWSLWVKPWEDDEAVLHEASTHYILMERGVFRYGAKVASSGKATTAARWSSRSRVVTPYTSEMVETGEIPFSGGETASPPTSTARPGTSSRIMPPNFNEQLRQLEDRRTEMNPSSPGTSRP